MVPGRTLREAAVGMHARDVSNVEEEKALGGFGWKVRSSPSDGLAEYRWQREDPYRLLESKWVADRSLEENSLEGSQTFLGIL